MAATQVTESQLVSETEGLESQIDKLKAHLSDLRKFPSLDATPEILTAKEIAAKAEKMALQKLEISKRETEADLVENSLALLRDQLQSKRQERKDSGARLRQEAWLGLATA